MVSKFAMDDAYAVQADIIEGWYTKYKSMDLPNGFKRVLYSFSKSGVSVALGRNEKYGYFICAYGQGEYSFVMTEADSENIPAEEVFDVKTKEGFIKHFERFCREYNYLDFEVVDNVRAYDDTTLFCPAGMQKYKNVFKAECPEDADKAVRRQYMKLNESVIANIQPCIRMNDLDDIGDGTHLLYFNMMGLFAFRTPGFGVRHAVKFWLDFLETIGLKPDLVTVHPDKQDWIFYYQDETVEQKYVDDFLQYNGPDFLLDPDCTWTDGEIGGYCTEFYIKDVEIGNIVNPLGNCIDCGFGLERILYILNNELTIATDLDTLKETILKILDSGYTPSNLKQGYVLRKLLREFVKKGGEMDHEVFLDEKDRQRKIYDRWLLLKDKHKDKSPEWWYDTHGIDLKMING